MRELQGFHIVMTLHNSRTSHRMIKYGVRKGKPILLDLEHEIELTRIIRDVILESGFHCLAFNVCKDHVHLILVCCFDDLSAQVQKIKSISSRLIKTHIPAFQDPNIKLATKGKKKYIPFWSQKFYYANLDVWKLATLSKNPGYIYGDSYLNNAIKYIRNNRIKHKLIRSTQLENIIEEFVEDIDTAFGI